MTALWSCGRSAFGIAPPRPLKVLIVQGEDGHNDSVSMAQVIDHLGLSEETRALVHQNTVVGQHVACDGPNFIAFLESALEATSPSKRPDVVIINPLNNFSGDDRDTTSNKVFASGLKRLMEEYRFGTVIIHHTPKTNYQSSDNYRPEDWQYADAGGWIITANARAKILIKSTKEPGKYRFVASKRGNRLDWPRGESGLPERFFKHSDEPDVLMWEDAGPVAKEDRRKKSDPGLDAVFTLVPVIDPEGKPSVEYAVQTKFDIGETKAKKLLQVLFEQERIFSWTMPRIKKEGRVPEGWCRRPQLSQAEIQAN